MDTQTQGVQLEPGADTPVLDVDALVEDVVVEEISIDGMCGVY